MRKDDKIRGSPKTKNKGEKIPTKWQVSSPNTQTLLARAHHTGRYTSWSLHVNTKQVKESVQKAHVVALRWLDSVSGTVKETTTVVHPDANRHEVSCVQLRLRFVSTVTQSDVHRCACVSRKFVAMTDYCKDFKPIEDMHSLKVDTKVFSKNFKIVSRAAFENPNSCAGELKVVPVVRQQGAITGPSKLRRTSVCAAHKKKILSVVVALIIFVIIAATASAGVFDEE
eukprot:SAG11_NODE_4171_length_2027_cov_9.634855_1_plen_227_part_00